MVRWNALARPQASARAGCACSTSARRTTGKPRWRLARRLERAFHKAGINLLSRGNSAWTVSWYEAGTKDFASSRLTTLAPNRPPPARMSKNRTIDGTIERMDHDEHPGREPCPEGNCIGIVGGDGRCTECGLSVVGGAVYRRPSRPTSGREPCPDSSCVGILDRDGRCVECGVTRARFRAAGLFDLETRQPCPDGSCIGVLNQAGVCVECGVSASQASPLDEADEFDLETREPCPDGSCIGVIGPDGRCSECG